MILLDTHSVAATFDELAEILGRTIGKYISNLSTPVRIYDEPSHLAIDLSGGRLNLGRKPGKVATAHTEPGPTFGIVTLTAEPLLVDQVAVTIRARATNLETAYAMAGGRLAATVTDAEAGSVLVSVSKADLSAGLLTAARAGAASAGVDVKSVDVTLRSTGPRSVEFTVAAVIKKFVSATVRVSGQLSVDDVLVATLMNLKADGEGMVGGVAVSFLRPHLQQVNGKSYSLAGAALGSLRVRDIKIGTSNGLAVSAEFGSSK